MSDQTSMLEEPAQLQVGCDGFEHDTAFKAAIHNLLVYIELAMDCLMCYTNGILVAS